MINIIIEYGKCAGKGALYCICVDFSIYRDQQRKQLRALLKIKLNYQSQHMKKGNCIANLSS